MSAPAQGPRRAATVLAVLLSSLAVPSALAWPAAIMDALSRDARRLVPRTLAQLMAEREKEIFEAARMFPPEVSQSLAMDLGSGLLRPETIAALDALTAEAAALLREQRVTEGVIRLGALMRIPADLSDPVLSAGPEGYPFGVTREYYAFVSASLDKIPVVIDNQAALRLERRRLPMYWQAVLGRSRSDSPVIGTELFQRGRIVSHRTIDYRSPVFGVASLAYSRAVTAIAATWLAVWRDVRGDVTRTPRPTVVAPVDAPPVPATPVLPSPPAEGANALARPAPRPSGP